MYIYLEGYDRGMFDSCGNFRKGSMLPEHEYQHEAGWRLVQFALLENFDLKLPEDEIFLNYGEAGKPCLSNHPDKHFNISHTSGLVACAAGDHPVGIDVERIRPFSKAVMRKLTEKERIYIQSSENQDEAFMRVWTMKEACIKLTGEGLAAFERTECIPGQPLQGIKYRQFIWQDGYIVTAMEKK